MKIIKNHKEAICQQCGCRGVDPSSAQLLQCRLCASRDLVGVDGMIFGPEYKHDSRHPFRVWGRDVERRSSCNMVMA